MSIVARGFGRKQTAAGFVVTGGFGLQAAANVPPNVIPYGSGGTIKPTRKKRRRDRDDVLLFIL